MASHCGAPAAGKHSNTSQFYITFGKTPACDGKHVVIGRVVEGLDVLQQIGGRNRLLLSGQRACHCRTMVGLLLVALSRREQGRSCSEALYTGFGSVSARRPIADLCPCTQERWPRPANAAPRRGAGSQQRWNATHRCGVLRLRPMQLTRTELRACDAACAWHISTWATSIMQALLQ